MLATLCMRKIGTIVLMDRKAETALKGTDMVLEEVRIFVQINSLERKFS